MKLSDCEISHRHIRGHNVAFLFGARAVSGEEAQALAAEYTEAYGPVPLPGYVSPDGWQTLAAVDWLSEIKGATEAFAVAQAPKTTKKKAA